MEILFYPTSRGHQPVYEWLKKIQGKEKDRYNRIAPKLSALQENGPLIRSLRVKQEYVKKLRNQEVWQLRVDDDRILFFFDKNGNIVLTNHFKKKSNNTPQKEIDTAERRRNIWLERND